MTILPEAFARLNQKIASEKLIAPIWGVEDGIAIVDQLRLPSERVIILATTAVEVARVIRSMRLRGSGAIGIAGAMGAYLAVRNRPDRPGTWGEAVHELKHARPTALILQTAVEEVLAAAGQAGDPVEGAAEAAVRFFEQQLAYERAIGRAGGERIPDGATVLTHCHSGALAGAGYGGRALSVIRGAVEAGKQIRVISQETRPYLQGARITAYELKQMGIPVTLATDGMSGALMQSRRVQAVVVGSDRLAINGDLANKVGTYLVALAAHEHGVPFYTATTRYNIDPNCSSGEQIPIEFRPAEEVLQFNGKPLTVPGIDAVYPTFDVTPAKLISGIITEQGVLEPPFEPKLRRMVQHDPRL